VARKAVCKSTTYIVALFSKCNRALTFSEDAGKLDEVAGERDPEAGRLACV
jgi:hypothetical protein